MKETLNGNLLPVSIVRRRAYCALSFGYRWRTHSRRGAISTGKKFRKEINQYPARAKMALITLLLPKRIAKRKSKRILKYDSFITIYWKRKWAMTHQWLAELAAIMSPRCIETLTRSQGKQMKCDQNIISIPIHERNGAKWWRPRPQAEQTVHVR